MIVVLSLFGCPEIALESVPLGVGLGGVAPVENQGGDSRWEITGTVTGVSNTAPDADFDEIPFTSATGVLRIGLPDDSAAVFGWSSVEDLEIPVAAGDDVSLVVGQRQPWGISQNAILRDGDGVLLAAFGIEGWGRAMEESDLPEVSPEMGDEVDRSENDCGPQIAREVRFGETGVRPFGGSRLDLEDGEYTGWAFGAWEYDRDAMICSDASGDFNWAVVRGFTH